MKPIEVAFIAAVFETACQCRAMTLFDPIPISVRLESYGREFGVGRIGKCPACGRVFFMRNPEASDFDVDVMLSTYYATPHD